MEIALNLHTIFADKECAVDLFTFTLKFPPVAQILNKRNVSQRAFHRHYIESGANLLINRSIPTNCWAQV